MHAGDNVLSGGDGNDALQGGGNDVFTAAAARTALPLPTSPAMSGRRWAPTHGGDLVHVHGASSADLSFVETGGVDMVSEATR